LERPSGPRHGPDRQCKNAGMPSGCRRMHSWRRRRRSGTLPLPTPPALWQTLPRSFSVSRSARLLPFFPASLTPSVSISSIPLDQAHHWRLAALDGQFFRGHRGVRCARGASLESRRATRAWLASILKGVGVQLVAARILRSGNLCPWWSSEFSPHPPIYLQMGC